MPSSACKQKNLTVWGLVSQALIGDKVILTLNGVSGFTESQIGSVTFLYGTPEAGLPGGTPVPEPGTLLLLGSGVVGLIDETWETWVDVGAVPIELHGSAFTLARARLSTGRVIKSIRNVNVPEEGVVPGGPI